MLVTAITAPIVNLMDKDFYLRHAPSSTLALEFRSGRFKGTRFRLVCIALLCHIIFNRNGYFSFLEAGRR